MANAFQAAASKAAAPQPAKAKKAGNIVVVSDADIATAIDEFAKADAQEKQFKAEKEVAKGSILPFCRTEFINQFADTGRKPETIKFRTPTGNSVTLVVQDRGEQYEVSAEQMETLRTLVGDEKLQKIVVEGMTFSFNNDILNKEGVMAALGGKIAALVAEEVLSETEAEQLLVATPRTTVRKGTIDDLARLCDNKPDQMGEVLAALGSHCSSYVKC